MLTLDSLHNSPVHLLPASPSLLSPLSIYAPIPTRLLPMTSIQLLPTFYLSPNQNFTDSHLTNHVQMHLQISVAFSFFLANNTKPPAKRPSTKDCSANITVSLASKFATLAIIFLICPSIYTLNSHGDRAHPCLTPSPTPTVSLNFLFGCTKARTYLNKT